MKISSEDKKRISNGDVRHLRNLLLVELEELKNQLIVYKPERDGYDNVLKGKAQTVQSILTLLEV